jgi:hypothetical protein
MMQAPAVIPLFKEVADRQIRLVSTPELSGRSTTNHSSGTRPGGKNGVKGRQINLFSDQTARCSDYCAMLFPSSRYIERELA